MQTLFHRLFTLVIASITSLSLCALGGCSATAKGSAPGDAAEKVAHGSSLPIFDGDSGLPMSWEGLLASAASADAVLIGEMHGHRQGLAAAADLFDAILARRPNTTALALEFMERDEQIPLDDYLDGVIDGAAFETAIGATDAGYPPGHRRMVEAARAANRPVIAANAPRRYVRLARTDGFDRLQALTSEQQRLVAIPDAITEGGYKDRFFGLMQGMSASHGSADDEPNDNSEMMLAMFRSQNVWDATMADSVAKAIAQGDAPVVLVVGQFHIDFNGGLVERLHAMRPGARIMTISMQDAIGPAFREEDRGRADVVINVGPAE